jgi:thiosulfate reductase cytochrome b subunit
MVMSGWRIYNASPLFDFHFPKGATLGGWLGGALQWHFAAMWIFGLNGLVYLLLNIITGRFRRCFSHLSFAEFWRDSLAALSGRLKHSDPKHYNMVQKFVYISVVFAAFTLALSGLVLWKSVQFAYLRQMLGGYETARYIHFYSMVFLALFIIVHLIMVVFVPKTLLTIIRGR